MYPSFCHIYMPLSSDIRYEDNNTTNNTKTEKLSIFGFPSNSTLKTYKMPTVVKNIPDMTTQKTYFDKRVARLCCVVFKVGNNSF